MDGICTNCGLAYSPDERECRQCGQELVASGGKPRGFLSRLFRRRREAERHPEPVRPEVAATSSQRIEIVGTDGERHVYGSLDEVPAADRARLERMQELGEDLLEGLATRDEQVTHRTVTTSGSSVSITVDGDAQVFTSFDEVPPELRDRIRDALERVEDLLPDDDQPDR